MAASKRALRLAVWMALYFVVALVAPAFWNGASASARNPALTVAFLWLLSISGRRTRIDLVALVATVALSDLVAQQTPLVILSTLLGLIGPFGTVLLLRRWTPQMWGGGGRAPMSTLSEFGWFLVALLSSTFVAALVRTGYGVGIIGGESWDLLLLRWGRSSAVMLVTGVLALLIGGEVARRRDHGLHLVSLPSPRAALEFIAITAAAGLVFWLGFGLNPQLPTTFLLSLSVVWAAVRFPVAVATVQAVSVSIATAFLTNAGAGPFAEVAVLERRMLLIYMLSTVMVVTSLVLSLTRLELVRTITKLRDSESELTLRAAELDQVLENLEDGVAIIEEGGQVVHSNTAVAHLLTGVEDAPPGEGISDETIEPAERYHLFHPDGRPLLDHDLPFVRAFRNEPVTAAEYHLRHPLVPGTRVLQINAFLVSTAPGDPRRSMVTVRDITVVKAHSDALAAFAGTVAHDLNNPLGVIDGWAEALEDEFELNESVSPTTGAPMVRHIRQGARLMGDFITDLLAHAVASDQDLHCELLDIDALVTELVTARQSPDINVVVAVGATERIWADRALVRQLLDNLLGNAMKYVAPGVQPRIGVATDLDEAGWVRLTMRDNGIGVPVEHRGQIFDTFHRASRDYSGTGLGLSICKRIVERHGGRISVQDNPEGPGSCFVMTLPPSSEALAAALSE